MEITKGCFSALPHGSRTPQKGDERDIRITFLCIIHVGLCRFLGGRMRLKFGKLFAWLILKHLK